MKTIAVVNQKGGQGKSLLTSQLAFHIALAMNKRVAVIDADEQGNTSYTLQKYATEGNYAHSFFGTEPIKAKGERSLVPFVSNKAGMRQVERMDGDLAADAQGRLILPVKLPALILNLKDRLADISPDFDWCLIDTPGSNSKVPNATLFAADYILVPSKFDGYSLEVTNDVLKRIMGVRALQMNPRAELRSPRLELIGVLPNQFKASDRGMVRSYAELEKKYPGSILSTRISDRSSLPFAAVNGVPIWKVPQTSAREATKEVRAAFELIGTKVGGF